MSAPFFCYFSPSVHPSTKRNWKGMKWRGKFWKEVVRSRSCISFLCGSPSLYMKWRVVCRRKKYKVQILNNEIKFLFLGCAPVSVFNACFTLSLDFVVFLSFFEFSIPYLNSGSLSYSELFKGSLKNKNSIRAFYLHTDQRNNVGWGGWFINYI